MGFTRAFRDGCEWHLCPLCDADFGHDMASSHSSNNLSEMLVCPGGSRPIN